MKRHVAIPLATVPWITAAAFPVHAHHSYPLFFDLCTSMVVEGRVDTVEWKDPHVMIHLTLDDGTSYIAEWTSPRGLSNRGVTTGVLKPGDRVVVTGSPFKDRSLMDPA